jgi:hypothetical protein
MKTLHFDRKGSQQRATSPGVSSIPKAVGVHDDNYDPSLLIPIMFGGRHEQVEKDSQSAGKRQKRKLLLRKFGNNDSTRAISNGK